MRRALKYFVSAMGNKHIKRISVGFGIAVIVAASVLLWHSLSSSVEQPSRKFPDGFLFGVATSSYQIEGAWDEDGKSESVWDRFTHSVPCKIKNCSNADIAANSYHLYKRDVEMLRELGVDFYRFSLSWPRLLPTGLPDQVNAAAVEFYNNYINEMIKYNITPVVTLFHWDFPQKLEEMGGWTSPYAADWFADYARSAFKLFGDRVKFWITINEPNAFCADTYKYHLDLALHENITKGVTEFECSKIMLMAHAKVWHIYNEEFRTSQGGNISIVLSPFWFEPANENNVNDVQAVQDSFYNHLNYIADPIFSKNGTFLSEPDPSRRTAARSAKRGYVIGRLPALTEQEKAYVRGTSDYFCINYYISMYVHKNETSLKQTTNSFYVEDVDAWYTLLPECTLGNAKLYQYVPWGFRKMLNKIKRDYGNPAVFVLENGLSTEPGLEDHDRIKYLRGHLDALLDAIDDGCDVRGYTYWSLMDSFEWMFGYKRRFGLYEVSFEEGGARPRRPRASARVYAQIVKTRALPPPVADASLSLETSPAYCTRGVL